jgi:serine O-acetyltransferase
MPSLVQCLTEDWRVHGRPFPFASAGYQTVALHRIGVWAMRRPEPRRTLLLAAHRFLATLCRNLYGIELPLDARVGRRLWIAHQGGIVVAHRAVIGDDCVIRHNVTIGGQRQRPAARLGDRVHVGPGAVILAGVRVGDDARVGPNAIVMTDVPAGGFVFAAPSRVVTSLDGNGAHRPPTDDLGLREFLCMLRTALDRTEPIAADEPLLSAGVIDSFDLATVVAAIEQRYGRLIPTDAIGVDTFDTPRQMYSLATGDGA